MVAKRGRIGRHVVYRVEYSKYMWSNRLRQRHKSEEYWDRQTT